MMRALALALWRDRRAAAAAEMALILPMAFALIFTTMEGGYYFQTEHKAMKYMREAARYATRVDLENFDCSGNGAWASGSTAAQTAIANVALSGNPTSSNGRIADWDASDIFVNVRCDSSYGTGLYANTANTKAVTVLVGTRFAYRPILGLLGFDVRNIEVVAQAEGAVIGS